MSIKDTKYQFLIKQYKHNIYSYALYMLRNKMDADDVTQEVFIRIWQNIGSFNILAAKTWILKTTHNLCIDFLRKRSSAMLKEFSIDEGFENFVSTEKSEHNPYLITHVRMMSSKIKDAIKELPENLRSVFVLYEIQGYKYKEISSALNIPINSVKVYLLRARKKLQEAMKNYEVQEFV